MKKDCCGSQGKIYIVVSLCYAIWKQTDDFQMQQQLITKTAFHKHTGRN